MGSLPPPAINPIGVGGGGGLDRIAKDGGTTTDDMTCCHPHATEPTHAAPAPARVSTCDARAASKFRCVRTLPPRRRFAPRREGVAAHPPTIRTGQPLPRGSFASLGLNVPMGKRFSLRGVFMRGHRTLTSSEQFGKSLIGKAMGREAASASLRTTLQG